MDLNCERTVSSLVPRISATSLADSPSTIARATSASAGESIKRAARRCVEMATLFSGSTTNTTAPAKPCSTSPVTSRSGATSMRYGRFPLRRSTKTRRSSVCPSPPDVAATAAMAASEFRALTRISAFEPSGSRQRDSVLEVENAVQFPIAGYESAANEDCSAGAHACGEAIQCRGPMRVRMHRVIDTGDRTAQIRRHRAAPRSRRPYHIWGIGPNSAEVQAFQRQT